MACAMTKSMPGFTSRFMLALSIPDDRFWAHAAVAIIENDTNNVFVFIFYIINMYVFIYFTSLIFCKIT